MISFVIPIVFIGLFFIIIIIIIHFMTDFGTTHVPIYLNGV